MRKLTFLVVAGLIVSMGRAASAERYQVLGLGGAGGMYTPAISPRNPKLMFISCDMSGDYRSTTGGKTWEMIDSMQLRSSRTCRPMFVGDKVYWTSGGELRVSEDEGATWKPVCPDGAPWKREAVKRLASLSGRRQALFVGVGNAVYVSRNGGKTWQKGPSGPGKCGGIAVAGGKVYASVGSKMWVSGDSGQTWQSLAVTAAKGQAIKWITAGSKGGRSIVYVIAGDVGVLRSLDGGKSWNHVLRLGGGDRDCILMATNQTEVAYACNRKEVYRTVNGGKNWERCFIMRGAGSNVERALGVLHLAAWSRGE